MGKTDKKKNRAVLIACTFIALITVIAIISIIGNSLSSNTSSVISTAANQTSAKSSQAETKPIYEDDYLSVSFVKKYDVPGMDGEFFFSIKAENKSKKEIGVYLKDVYINDTMVQVGSGVPLNLLPGKNNTHSFFGKYEGTGISKASEIKKIGFKIWVTDKDTNTIETTKDLEIKF